MAAKVPSLGDLQLGGRWVEIDPRLERRPEETVIVKKGVGVLRNEPRLRADQPGHRLGDPLRGDDERVRPRDGHRPPPVRVPDLVPRECVGDRAQAHEANLFDIQAKYADVVPLEEALAYVERLAGGGRAGVTHRIAVLPGTVSARRWSPRREGVDALGLSLSWTELPWGSPGTASAGG